MQPGQNPTARATHHPLSRLDRLLTGADVAPLVILDVEAVETTGEEGGPTLPDLLAAHEKSQLSAYGFREWLLATYPGTGIPSRIQKVWSRHWDQVVSAIDTAGG